jgi:hypothetical protein
MSKLSQETIDRIEADAISWSENQYGHDDVNKDYLEGALHEAGRAQPVIDLSQEIVMLFDPTRRHVLVPADVILRLSNAIAKYKEVSNG